MFGPVVRLARRWHGDEPFDLVMGVQMNGEVATAVRVGRSLGIPVAAMAIGTDLMVLPDLVPGLRRKITETLREVDLPIAVSEALAGRMREACACRRPPFVARLPRDTEAFRPAADRAAIRRSLEIAEDDVVVIYVGRLEAPKGMDELCAAAGALLDRHPRFRLFCLGEGAERQRLLELCPGRPGAVVAPGRVVPGDVPGHLQAADIFVLPSHSEGLPQVVLEAMNCGLPVVATDVGGTSEAVLDGETGLLVPAKDAAALESAIERLVLDPAMRERMGARGLEYARDEFDPEQHTERLASALRSIVSTPRPPG
jgi:glycosyltransferase involved in cell wall biosynthesis